jgi:hypothetical protein
MTSGSGAAAFNARIALDISPSRLRLSCPRRSLRRSETTGNNAIPARLESNGGSFPRLLHELHQTVNRPGRERVTFHQVRLHRIPANDSRQNGEAFGFDGSPHGRRRPLNDLTP